MSTFEAEVREAMAATAKEIRERVTAGEKAAMAWDKAAREGTLRGPPTPPDTQPRNSLTGRPTTFNATVTINGKASWDGGGRTIDRDFIPTNPWGRRR